MRPGGRGGALQLAPPAGGSLLGCVRESGGGSRGGEARSLGRSPRGANRRGDQSWEPGVRARSASKRPRRATLRGARTRTPSDEQQYTQAMSNTSNNNRKQ